MVNRARGHRSSTARRDLRQATGEGLWLLVLCSFAIGVLLGIQSSRFRLRLYAHTCHSADLGVSGSSDCNLLFLCLLLLSFPEWHAGMAESIQCCQVTVTLTAKCCHCDSTLYLVVNNRVISS